jgi:ubiquinone/menaquinone biosynthesis C-methylase UbiE
MTTTFPNSALSAERLGVVKTKQQATWASGNYAVIGTTLQIIGETLCEAMDMNANWKVLDVAAGNGNASLAAARRGCAVTAMDYVESLLDGARRRADAEDLRLDIRVGDAENLEFGDGEFDAVLSTLGVMFVPDPDRAARELVRVCKPGGFIGLANWTPEGFIGQMFKIVGQHNPPPAGVPSPLAWGTDARIHELLGSDTTITINRRHFVFRYESAEHMFETFKAYYGPVVKAWAAVDDEGKRSLQTQLVALMNANNRATHGGFAAPAEYLEVVARRND